MSSIPSAEREQLRLRNPRRLHPDIPISTEHSDPMGFIGNVNVEAETERKRPQLLNAMFAMMRRKTIERLDPMALLSDPETDIAKESRENASEYSRAALSLLTNDSNQA